AMSFLSERADFTLTFRAKLLPDRTQAMTLLHEALDVQRRHGSPLGEARSLLLLARMDGASFETAGRRERLIELKARTPALGGCALFGHVLEHWDAWISGDPLPGCDGEDFYCGV
ncbi:MAG: hypothetical protein ACREIV_10685, partial [Planctomycetaceae bacterium]